MNILQQEALQWLLIDEAENEAELFETNLRFMVLANNPQLYKAVWPDDTDQDVEWLTPQSQEEIDAILEQLEEIARTEESLQQETVRPTDSAGVGVVPR